MKTVLVNGTEKNIEAKTSFGAILQDISLDVKASSHVISSVRIDGNEISDTDREKLAGTEISQLGKLEIVTANSQELVQETLGTLDLFMDRIMQGIERAAALYKNKNYIAADDYFIKSIDGLDLFVQTITGVKQILRMGVNPKVAVAEAALISIMNDVLEAKKDNNYVLLADLLQVDIIESLREWKTVVLPIFKSMKVS